MKIKPLNIFIEAIALSYNQLTGIGKVALHYIKELERIDTINYYYIYAYNPEKYLTIKNPRWKIIRSKNPISNRTERLKANYTANRETFKKTKNVLFLLLFIMNRFLKAFLETVTVFDEFYKSSFFHLYFHSFFKKNRIDVLLSTSAHFIPKKPVKGCFSISILYDLVWKLYPATMGVSNKIMMNMITKRNLSRPDLFVSISESTKRDCIEHLNIVTDIRPIPLAADRGIFNDTCSSERIDCVKKKFNITKKYILSVSTIEPRKNIIFLTKAFCEMGNELDINLVLVGKMGWGNNPIFEYINKCGKQDSIIVTGYVPDEDLAPLYKGAEVFVFPSVYEGFGLPVLEAMQCGCPVITSNVSSMPEVAGDAAILVDPYDIMAIKDAIERVLKDKSLRQEMIRKGLKRAGEFSWERSASRLLELFGESR